MFILVCNDGELDINKHIKGFKRALAFVKALPNRRYNPRYKKWYTPLNKAEVIKLVPIDRVEKKIVKKFPPNKYQKPIVDHVIRSNTGSTTLVASDAGTGKTATIIMINEATNETMAGIAFNKGVANELNNRGVSGFTFNSFGFRALKGRKINKYKYYDLVKSNLNESEIKQKLHVKVVALWEKSRNMLSREYADLALQFAIDFKDEQEQRIYNLVDDLWFRAELNNFNDYEIDFTDQIFHAVMSDAPLPYVDILCIDECQDINPLRYALIQNYIKQHPQTKVVWVGDDKQAINGWSGTLDNAMEVLAENAKTFELLLTYRNAMAIIDHVKNCHPNVKTETASKILGSVQDICQEEMSLKMGDMVICKHNAPLVKLALGLVKQGNHVTVKGKDISGKLNFVINKAGVTNLNHLSERCTIWLDSIKDKCRTDIFEQYSDNVDCLIALAEVSENLSKLIYTVKKLFSDENSPITLSSIHRSKGLEAQNVYILCNDDKLVLPTGELKGDQSLNLAYVARTRAIENLYYVVA